MPRSRRHQRTRMRAEPRRGEEEFILVGSKSATVIDRRYMREISENKLEVPRQARDDRAFLTATVIDRRYIEEAF
jgi:hypothetical protein